MHIEWEPETLALLAEAGQEPTQQKVNRTVREWCKQILRHRRYLKKVKADPKRLVRFKAKRDSYKKHHRQFGPKRRKSTKAGERNPAPNRGEDMCERMMKLSKKPPFKERDGILVLGKL